MLFCKLGVSFEISKKLKFSIEPFFCDVINDVIGAIFFPLLQSWSCYILLERLFEAD